MELYTEKELIAFGNYLLESRKTDTVVSHADRMNWLEGHERETGVLPSAHQLTDEIILCFSQTSRIKGWVHSVRFFEGKVKYDLEIELDAQTYTRLYNIDSAFVSKT